MLEQIQTSSDGISLLAGKGKGGKQGVFANLFKALASKDMAGDIAAGMQGKAGKHAALMPGKALLANLKAHAEAATEAEAGSTGKAHVKATAIKGLKALIMADEVQEETPATGIKTANGKKLITSETAEWNPQATAIESVARTASSNTGKAASIDQQESSEGKNAFRRSDSRQGRLQNGNSSRQQHDEATQVHARHGKGQPDVANSKSPLDSSQDTSPRFGIAQARAVDTHQVPSAGRAADKPASAGHADAGRQSAKAARQQKPAGETTQQAPLESGEAQLATAEDKGKRRSSVQGAAKSSAPQHDAGETRQAAGAIDGDALQHDTDAVQRIREELAAMANRAAGKSARASRAKMSNNDVQATAKAAAQTDHGQAVPQHAHTASPAQTSAQASAQAVSAQAAATAAATAGADQQSGGQDAARQDSTDSRLTGTVQTDARPQPAFDLQQQAAARMAQPMRPLEAMQSIAHSAANGSTKLELQLEPAHLGKIHISLQTDAAKQLQMHLTVEHGMTRQVIEQHMPQLRAALEQQGLNLDNFSLHTGSQGQQQQQAFEHTASRHPGNDEFPSAGEAQGSAPGAPTRASSRLSIHI